MGRSSLNDVPDQLPEAQPPAASAESAPPGAQTKPGRRRLKKRVVLVRVAAYGVVGMALVALLAWGAVKILMTPTFIKAQLGEQVAVQTGGRLEVASVQFDPLTGIVLQGVRYYPPAVQSGAFVVAEEALVEIASVEARYSVPRLLAGRLLLPAMRLVEPRVHLRRNGETWNFAAIADYRAAKFSDAPPPPLVGPPKPEPKTEGLLPFNPALLYMPIEVMIRNIGVVALSVDIEERQGDILTKQTNLEGVSLDLGVHWFGRKSSLWFQLLSPVDQELAVSVQERRRDPQGDWDETLRQTLQVKTALSLRLALDDLKHVSLDYAMRVGVLETPAATFRDVGAFARLRATIADDYQGIVFDDLDVDLAAALLFGLNGSISVPGGTGERIDLRLKQRFALDLKAVAELARPFLPALHASGRIECDGLKVEGSIEPKKLADFDQGIALPFVVGTVWLQEVWAGFEGVPARIEPISGDIAFAVGPSLTGIGSQVDLAVDLSIPKVEATQPGPAGPVTAEAQGLAIKVIARALWPEMAVPIAKINVEAEHVRAHGAAMADVNVPLYVDLDLEGRKDLARAALATSIELSGLAELSLMADCQVRCTKFRSNTYARLDSLEKIHAIGMPMAKVLGLGDRMPTKLTGSFDAQVSVRGRGPDPLVTPLPELLKAADVRINAQTTLAKVNVQLPLMKTSLKNFEQRLSVNGSLNQQKIDLQQKFESLGLELPAKPDDPAAKAVPVSVGRWDLGITVENIVQGPLDLQAALKQLQTSVEGWVYFGKLEVPTILPTPLSEFQLEYELAQASGAELQVRKFDLRLPSLGTTVAFTAATEIDKDYFPKWFKSDLNVAANHSGDERLPVPLKTSGQFNVKVGISSDDMRTIALDGGATFDRFNLTVPGASDGDPAKLIVEDMRGGVPIKQKLTLPNLKALVIAKSNAATDLKATKDSEAVGASKTPTADDEPEVPLDAGDDGTLAAIPKEAEALRKTVDSYLDRVEDKLAKSANVTALVDYGTVRPFYPTRRPLSIRRIEAANLEASRMEFDLELRQNWLAVNQFVIAFLGGKIQGDMQLAFDASPLVLPKPEPLSVPQKVRLSVHLTRLDTRKLLERFPELKGKAEGSSLFANPFIDATVHLVIDLRANDLSGGIEISSIGKDQLRMILYYVDPFEQNPTIAQIRQALAFGEVSQVSIPLKNGEIGMDVDVRVFGTPLPIPKLTRFPISQIIQNYKDQALKEQAQNGEIDGVSPPEGGSHHSG